MARQKAPDKSISKSEAFGLLAEKLKTQAVSPNVLAYKPHAKQIQFHSSLAKIKLYIGGNRSGKTHGGVVEDIWRLKGEHPFRKVPPAPARGRIVCVDFNQGINGIIIPKLKQLIPPSLLIGGSWDKSYHTQEKVLTCSNGSTIELMTYEQKVDAFAGTSRHWVHYDEEPPKSIYNECQARLIDVDGDSFLTMTPLLGMTWIYDEIYLPGLEQRDPDIEVITVSMDENPYLPVGAKERFLKNLDPEERKAREKGIFVSMGGLIYKTFDPGTADGLGKHVIPYTPELLAEVRKYQIYTGMDHGYNAPTAWIWVGVAADGTIVVFEEHYQSEWVVSQHAQHVQKRESELKINVHLRVADPALAQRQGVTGTSIQTEYAINGISLSLGNNDVKTGIIKVQQYLGINPATGKPYLMITENCQNLIKEMKRYRWKTYTNKKTQDTNNPMEEAHKKDDHLCDALRYLVGFMPDLAPAPEQKLAETFEVSKPQRYDELLARMAASGAVESTTQWTENTGVATNWEWEG